MADEPLPIIQFLALKDNFVIGRMLTPDPNPDNLPTAMDGEVWMLWGDRTVLPGSFYDPTTNTFAPPPDAPGIGIPPEPLPETTPPPAVPTKRVDAVAIADGGADYVIADMITLPNNVALEVTAIVAGAVDTVAIQNPGSVAASNVPSNPVAQIASSGAGTGATFDLTWVDVAAGTMVAAMVKQAEPRRAGRYINTMPPPSGRR